MLFATSIFKYRQDIKDLIAINPQSKILQIWKSYQLGATYMVAS